MGIDRNHATRNKRFFFQAGKNGAGALAAQVLLIASTKQGNRIAAWVPAIEGGVPIAVTFQALEYDFPVQRPHSCKPAPAFALVASPQSASLFENAAKRSRA